MESIHAPFITRTTYYQTYHILLFLPWCSIKSINLLNNSALLSFSLFPLPPNDSFCSTSTMLRAFFIEVDPPPWEGSPSLSELTSTSSSLLYLSCLYACSAALMSLAVTHSLSSAIAAKTAFFTSRYRSAPEQPSVRAATSSKPSSASCSTLRVVFSRICSLSASLGLGTSSWFSILPDLSTASSMMSSRLVAAITNTIFLSSTPSSSFRRVLTTLQVTWLPWSDLLGAKASNSSKNMMQGEHCLALSNTLLTDSSDQPTYLERSYGPLTVMKLALAQLAMALAIMVLPQPGGPYIRIPPPLTSKFIFLNLDCCLRGMMISCLSLVLICSSPPTSSSLTVGILAKPSFLRTGCMTLKALRMSSILTCGSLTSSSLPLVLFRHFKTAYLRRATRSIVTNPALIIAVCLIQSAVRQWFVLLRIFWIISCLIPQSGFGILNCLQNNPGLLSTSNFQGAHEAPIKYISLSLLLRIILHMVNEGSPCILLLLSLLHSSSRLSMNTTEGADSSAASNSFLRRSSESPPSRSQLLTSQPETFLLGSLVRQDKIQRASSVLPVPTEPLIRKPRLGDPWLICFKTASYSKSMNSYCLSWAWIYSTPPSLPKSYSGLSSNSTTNSFFLTLFRGFPSGSASTISTALG